MVENPPQSGVPKGPSRTEAHFMFDRISRRYDLLNRILSFGLDIYWRRRLIGKLESLDESGKTLRVLDLATGTGDVALAISRRFTGSAILGIDKSEQMLKLALQKRRSGSRTGSVSLARGDGLAIPVQDSSFDAVTIAFGIRNMPDTLACLSEMRRLLAADGKALILEFSFPRNVLLRPLHRIYLRYLVPLIGRIVSGDAVAYRYLDQTIETYTQGDEFCTLMKDAGFTDVSASRLNGGIVTIYEGKKS